MIEKSCASVKRLVVAAAMLLSFISGGCKNYEVYQVLDAESGGAVKVVYYWHDDPGVLVDGIAVGSLGRSFGRVALGSSWDFNLPPGQFGLYQARSGRLVGLYRRIRPEELLMIADFDEKLVVSKSDQYTQAERTSEYLRALSRAAGMRLTLRAELVHAWAE